VYLKQDASLYAEMKKQIKYKKKKKVRILRNAKENNFVNLHMKIKHRNANIY
jgi:hypothetical protein